MWKSCDSAPAGGPWPLAGRHRYFRVWYILRSSWYLDDEQLLDTVHFPPHLVGFWGDHNVTQVPCIWGRQRRRRVKEEFVVLLQSVVTKDGDKRYGEDIAGIGQLNHTIVSSLGLNLETGSHQTRQRYLS